MNYGVEAPYNSYYDDDHSTIIFASLYVGPRLLEKYHPCPV